MSTADYFRKEEQTEMREELPWKGTERPKIAAPVEEKPMLQKTPVHTARLVYKVQCYFLKVNHQSNHV